MNLVEHLIVGACMKTHHESTDDEWRALDLKTRKACLWVMNVWHRHVTPYPNLTPLIAALKAQS